MSEIEEPSSTFELETIAMEELKKRAKEKAAKAQVANVQNVQPEPADEQISIEPAQTKEHEPVAAPPVKKTIARKKSRPAAKHVQNRELARKHDSERRALQKNLNEMAKKRERDIRDLMDKVLKDHYAQVDRERGDYLAVLAELKKSLEGQGREIATSCQQVVTTAAQDEVDRMVNWFHEEFMQELTKKSQQYEELKLSSEKQVNKMSQESDNKSQKIMILDEKIRELAMRLPKDVRLELFEELGLEQLEEVKPQAKAEKKQGKGIFSKLSQMFKRRTAKPKTKPVSGKAKQAKAPHKRASPQSVIAQ